MEDRIKLEVSGVTFSLTQDQLDKGPPSKLVSLCKNSSSMVILDRPSESFSAVLALYQTGELHIPASLCPISLLNELEYWNISPLLISKCCKERLERFLDEQELVRDFKKFQKEKRPIFQIMFCEKASSFRAKMWTIVDYTQPTVFGAIYFSISLLMILASILALAYSTDPTFSREMTACEKIDYLLSMHANISAEWNEKLHEFCSGNPDDTMEMFEKLGSDGVLKVIIQYPETVGLKEIIANKVDSSDTGVDTSASTPFDGSSSANDSYERPSRSSGDIYICCTPPILGSQTWETPPIDNSHTWNTPPVLDSNMWHAPPAEDRYVQSTSFVDDSFSSSTSFIEGIPTRSTSPSLDSYSWSTPLVKDSYSQNAPSADDSYARNAHSTEDRLKSSTSFIEDSYTHNAASAEYGFTRSTSFIESSFTQSTTTSGVASHTWSASSIEDSSMLSKLQVTDINASWSSSDVTNTTARSIKLTDITTTPSANTTLNISLLYNGTIEFLIPIEPEQTTENLSHSWHAKRTTSPPVLLNIRLLDLEVPHIKVKVYSLVICGIITTVFFTLDFVMRILSCPCIVRYFTSIINIVDALALASTYLHMLLIFLYQYEQYTNTWIQVLEYSQMARAFRLFRTIANVRAGKVLSYTVFKNGKDLLIMGLFLVAGMCIYASCFYLSEDHKDVPTIPDAWYWAIITMTTVGYGDMAPKTFLGRMFSSLCAVTGVLLLALTVPIFAASFMTLYNHVETQNMETKIKRWRENSLKGTSYRRSSESTNGKCSTAKHETC